MQLYIIRHADPDYKNHTITPDGHLEAEALSRRLKAMGVNKIFCSPLGRARDTMQYTAKLLNLESETEEWTKELSDMLLEDSDWGPLMAWDLPGEIQLADNPDASSTDWNNLPEFKDLNLMERYANIGKNSDLFIKKLGYKREGRKYRCIQPNEDKVAVFCHGGFGITWIAHLLNIPLRIMWSGFSLSPSSVTIISFDTASEIWVVPRCKAFGDTSHLYESGLIVKWPIKETFLKNRYSPKSS